MAQFANKQRRRSYKRHSPPRNATGQHGLLPACGPVDITHARSVDTLPAHPPPEDGEAATVQSCICELPSNKNSTSPQPGKLFASTLRGLGSRLCFFFFLNKSPLKFIYWPCWVFVAGPRLSPAVVSRASAPWCSGFSPWRPAPLHRMAFRSCGSGAPGGQAQAWWHTGLVAPQHVRSSRAGGCTGVPCIARQL